MSRRETGRQERGRPFRCIYRSHLFGGQMALCIRFPPNTYEETPLLLLIHRFDGRWSSPISLRGDSGILSIGSIGSKRGSIGSICRLDPLLCCILIFSLSRERKIGPVVGIDTTSDIISMSSKHRTLLSRCDSLSYRTDVSHGTLSHTQRGDSRQRPFLADLFIFI